MRDPARIDRVLAAVRAAWIKQPDTRLGQLISNTADMPIHLKQDVFYIEDDLLEFRLTHPEDVKREHAKALRRQRTEQSARLHESNDE